MEIGINMRNFILLMFAIFSINLYGGTCSSISRTDFVDGNILSASDLNTQFSTAYSAVNAADGGCITDGTLELGALGTSEFSPQLKGIRKGCIVKAVATSSFEISACLATVNGKNVDKTATTSVTYANLDTGSMATSTTYYIFIDSASTGSTLTPKISATAPNALGYNATNDLLLARFQTASSTTEVMSGSEYQYGDKGYSQASRVTEVFFIDSSGALTGGYGGFIQSCTKPSAGLTQCTSNINYAENTIASSIPKAYCWVQLLNYRDNTTYQINPALLGAGQVMISVYTRDATAGTLADSDFYLFCSVELKRN